MAAFAGGHEVVATVPLSSGEPGALGPLEVAVDLGAWPGLLRWSVANTSPTAVSVTSVSLLCRLASVAPPLRVLRHGYQSWSETSVATLGVDSDPSLADGSIELVRGMHHADPTPASPGELRSEQVTVLADASGRVLLVGADGGERHATTIRVRPGEADPVLVLEAHLGGATLAGGELRHLHGVVLDEGTLAAPGPAELLEAWAARVGAAARARIDAPYQVGWCSWYHYFHGVTEADLRANLARASDWPFEVFQLDDGFQAAVGDWLETNDRFPSPLDALAEAIAAQGRVPGIWLAPFLVAPESSVARRHPDWLAGDAAGERPLLGMWNPGWGGAAWTLDTTHPAVQEHLVATARALVEAGFRYLKLDFTYAPGLAGRYHDRALTPAERVRAGFDAVRLGAGDDVFLLGCGAPLGPTVGVVDGMRIGPDVAPRWGPDPVSWHPPGYLETTPSTRGAWRATLARSFMHRRLWLNDPDCLMLRSEATEMTSAQVSAWAGAVAASGGMALVSDDLALLGPDAHSLLEEVITVGRQVDEAARLGPPPRCPDLLERRDPCRLESPVAHLSGDPTTGVATLTGAPSGT